VDHLAIFIAAPNVLERCAANFHNEAAAKLDKLRRHFWTSAVGTALVPKATRIYDEFATLLELQIHSEPTALFGNRQRLDHFPVVDDVRIRKNDCNLMFHQLASHWIGMPNSNAGVHP